MTVLILLIPITFLCFFSASSLYSNLSRFSSSSGSRTLLQSADVWSVTHTAPNYWELYSNTSCAVLGRPRKRLLHNRVWWNVLMAEDLMEVGLHCITSGVLSQHTELMPAGFFLWLPEGLLLKRTISSVPIAVYINSRKQGNMTTRGI